ncbi:MAG: phosphate ABC transporter ATP-binding protein [Pseudomonadota bacterium]|nr:phosphate ABC transporter ATP-binding protein [Pseudomonadota bacterium]
MNKELPEFYPSLPLKIRPDCCEPSPHFQIENLSLKYGSKFAFRNIKLTLNRGCITALVGPSGCGKTSFLMCLNRLIELIPGASVTGEIFFDTQDLMKAKTPVIELRRKVGMIFQKPNPFPQTIRKNIEFPLKEHGILDPIKRREILERALTDVGLWQEVKDRLEAPALTLSGGQQQRLCIARAIALEPEVLLMDEPCSSLDPISSGVVEDLIASLRQRFTVLIVTHNLAQARRIADYVAFFWLEDGAGSLIESGPTKQIFNEPRHKLTAAYIGGLRG